MIPSHLWLSNGLIPIPATYCFPAEVSKLSRIHIWEPPGCCKGRCFCSFNPTPSTGISFPTEKDALAIFGWCFGTKSGTHLNTLHSFHVLCQGIHLTCFFEFLFFSPYIDCICMYVWAKTAPLASHIFGALEVSDLSLVPQVLELSFGPGSPSELHQVAGVLMQQPGLWDGRPYYKHTAFQDRPHHLTSSHQKFYSLHKLMTQRWTGFFMLAGPE